MRSSNAKENVTCMSIRDLFYYSNDYTFFTFSGVVEATVESNERGLLYARQTIRKQLIDTGWKEPKGIAELT